MPLWDKDPIVGSSKDESISADQRPWDKDPVYDPSEKATTEDYIKGFSGGFNTGATQMIGAPVDITSAVLKKAGVNTGETPFMGSNWIKKQIEKVEPFMGEMYAESPKNIPGRVISRVGEELGATTVPTGLMLKAAKKTIAPISSIERGFVQEQILDPIRRNTGRASLGELSATVGAGTGAGIAQEVAPGSSGAETTGQVVGGVAPTALAYTPTAIVAKTITALSSRFSSAAQKKASQELVSKLLGKSLTDEAKRRIKKAEQLGQKIKGFSPSIAESTGKRVLITQQESIEKHATGKLLEDLVMRRNNNEKAIYVFSNKARPDGPDDIDFVIDSASNRIDIYNGKIAKSTGENLQKQKGLAKTLPNIDKEATGIKMREAINNSRAETSVKMSLRAKELGISDAKVEVQFSEWQNQIKAMYKKKSRFEDVKSRPEIYKEIIRKQKTGKDGSVKPTTFQDIKTLRERITDDIIDNLGSANPSRRKIRTLISLKSDVDGLIDDIGGTLG
ncbi:MAG: hypothetical protein ABIA37_05540, partial [Candidatus Woesearchaeota archaeon]